MDRRYTVTQAAGVLGVKSYVLRYWEDELSLRIRRNEQGHRYYTEYDLALFSNIRELKNRGLQLRAIREVLPKITQTVPGTVESRVKLLEASDMGEQSAAGEVCKDKSEVCREAATAIREDGKILEFQKILERLIDQELRMKRTGEDRCRSLDAAIRRQQLARKEAAVTLVSAKKLKKMPLR